MNKKSDTLHGRYQRGPGYDKFFMRKHCTLKYVKEFRTSKMCHKCAWDPKTEKMNEALFEKRNSFFHGQLEQFQYDEVKNVIDNLKSFKMANIYDSTKTAKKQLKSLRKEKRLVETILNKEDEFCNDSELKFKKNKQHNEYRTNLLYDYKKYLRESKLNNDLVFSRTNASNFDAKTLKHNYKIIDAFHLVKKKIQDKHEKIYNKNDISS